MAGLEKSLDSFGKARTNCNDSDSFLGEAAIPAEIRLGCDDAMDENGKLAFSQKFLRSFNPRARRPPQIDIASPSLCACRGAEVPPRSKTIQFEKSCALQGIVARGCPPQVLLTGVLAIWALGISVGSLIVCVRSLVANQACLSLGDKAIGSLPICSKKSTTFLFTNQGNPSRKDPEGKNAKGKNF